MLHISANTKLQRPSFGAASTRTRKQPQVKQPTDLDLEALTVKLTELEAICSQNWTKESSERTSDVAEVRCGLKKLEVKMNESKSAHHRGVGLPNFFTRYRPRTMYEGRYCLLYT